MFNTKRYLYVLFCCQQAVEKRLKGLVARVTGAMPARTHDLMRLAESAAVKPSADQELFLRRLGQYYIETRYPEEMHALVKTANRRIARKYLAETREVIAWLDRFLKLK
jgi:HEPN domain-containing protein